MKVILFGATGMVGQGVLRECVLDPEVEAVLSVSRGRLPAVPLKTEELIHGDFYDFDSIAYRLTGYDACLFCLGVSSAGKSEAEYTSLTYALTLAAAEAVLKANPAMTFLYISGAGTDSTESGRSMWARVKGRTENALLRMPFRASYMFRPAYIQPMHGVTSKTGLYRMIYVVVSPLYPLLRAMVPKYVTTTEQVGRAMVEVAKNGYAKPILESAEIVRAASARPV